MKKIGYDLSTEAGPSTGSKSSADMGAFVKICAKLHGCDNLTTSLTKAESKAQRGQSVMKRKSEENTKRGKHSLAINFHTLFSSRATEVDIFHETWDSIQSVLKTNKMGIPVYRNILLLQDHKSTEAIRIEILATSFLEKMHAHYTQMSMQANGAQTRKSDINRYRIDFSCINAYRNEAYVMCPEKNSANQFVPKPSSVFVSNKTTTYAHFVSKLPKWRNISLIPDPELFFQTVCKDSAMSKQKTSQARDGKKGNEERNTIFVFHIYRADTKELIAVVSMMDIGAPLMDLRQNEIFTCVDAMLAGRKADPASLFTAYWHKNVCSALDSKCDKEKPQPGIIRQLSKFLAGSSWKSEKGISIDRFFAWLLLRKQENLTFFILNIKHSSDIIQSGKTLTMEMPESFTPTRNRQNLKKVRTESTSQSTMVKFVPIDLAPNVQYRFGRPARRKRRYHKKDTKDQSTVIQHPQRHSISQTIRLQNLAKAEQIFHSNSVALLFQTLSVTKSMATQMMQFLKYFRENIDRDNVPSSYCMNIQILEREPNPMSQIPSAHSQNDAALTSHEFNEMKARMQYLTEKVREHEVRESEISEKEAAIEQWEMRRETLNNSVEELVSLLNNQRSDDSHQKLKAPLMESLAFQQSAGSIEYLPEQDIDGLTELQASQSNENSFDMHFWNDDASQNSTPISHIESHTQNKPFPAESPFEMKKSLFQTPMSSESIRTRPCYSNVKETASKRSSSRFGDKMRPIDTETSEVADENKLLRSNLEVLRAYVSELESQAKVPMICEKRVSELEGTIVPQGSARQLSSEQMHQSISRKELVPSYVVSGMQRIHHYADFLFATCKRATKMSVWLKKSMKEELDSMHQKVKQDMNDCPTGKETLGTDESSRHSRQKEKSLNDQSRDRDHVVLTPHSEPGIQLRSARDHIKKLLVKVASKEKENTQWQTKVDKLTRELRSSSNKEINLRNQLDVAVQRHQLLMKDFTMFKKNLRKVDKETEKIQNQNRILKDQLEKIESNGSNMYNSTRRPRDNRPVQFLEQQPLSNRPEMHSFREDDELSNSTVLSARTFDEMSCYSMNISQASSPVHSSMRAVRLPVPKLSLDAVQAHSGVDGGANMG